MNRKEEILEYCGENHYKPFSTEACVAIKAIEWADQHKRKELWDSKKVTEWLKNNSHKYVVCDESDFSHYAYNSLIEDLRKAMDE